MSELRSTVFAKKILPLYIEWLKEHQGDIINDDALINNNNDYSSPDCKTWRMLKLVTDTCTDGVCELGFELKVSAEFNKVVKYDD